MNNNSNISFNDPVNQSGDWHNNYAFRDYHTQSTHSQDNGCASWGGMDDRFDFVLISNDIKNGSKHIKYLDGSYWAVGQDGNHFNKGLLDAPTNVSVPSNVLNALGKNSDHLPVTLKLSVAQPVGIDEFQYSLFTDVSFVNPVSKNLRLNLSASSPGSALLSIYDLTGKVMIQKILSLTKGGSMYSVDLSNLNPGLYIIRLTDKNGVSVSRKMMKQ